MVLVDGGILNNVPTNLARDMGAELIIAVDVMPNYSSNVPGEEPLVLPLDPLLPEFMQELFNVEYIMISALTAFRLAETPPQLLITPQLPQSVDLLIGFERAEEVIEAGVLATREALARFEIPRTLILLSAYDRSSSSASTSATAPQRATSASAGMTATMSGGSIRRANAEASRRRDNSASSGWMYAAPAWATPPPRATLSTSTVITSS